MKALQQTTLRIVLVLLGFTLVCGAKAYAFGGKQTSPLRSDSAPDCRWYICKIDPTATEDSEGESLSRANLSHETLANDEQCWKSLDISFAECLTIQPELQETCYSALLWTHAQLICIGTIRTNDAD